MLSALISAALRLILTAATVLLVLALMAVALVSLLGLLLWSLIRGRRPTIDLSGFARARQFRAGRPGAAAAAPPRGEVVDVEAREVPEQAPRIE
ncbi:MAG: hypothetical protein ABW005_03320 [Burkholderiaceae bacterium]